MPATASTSGSTIFERALEAAVSRFERALTTGTPYYAYLYDEYELSAIFGEREFRLDDDGAPADGG